MSTDHPTHADFAQLSKDAVAKLESLEHALGDVYVLAYHKPITPAPLTAEQLQLLQRAEQELGVCLVAYRAEA